MQLRQIFMGFRILHGALASMIVVYGAIAFAFVKPQAKQQIDPNILVAIFGVISVGLLASIPMLRKKLMPERRDGGTPLDHSMPVEPQMNAPLNKLRSLSVLSWALAESVAMFGLVVAFMTGMRGQYLPFGTLALIAMVGLRPTRRLFDSVIRPLHG